MFRKANVFLIQPCQKLIVYNTIFNVYNVVSGLCLFHHQHNIDEAGYREMCEIFNIAIFPFCSFYSVSIPQIFDKMEDHKF